MLRRSLLAALLVLGATGAASAQNLAVIKERQGHLEAMGKAVKEPTQMYKGEAEFDLDKIKKALAVIQEKAPLLPKLFPDDSKKGEDTEALPAIWENKKDFEDRYPKLATDAKAASEAITDEETFYDQWEKVMGNCSECHKKYRKKKEQK
jgi:cytochrome c556